MKEKNQNKEQNTNQNQEQNQKACIRMGRGRHEAVPFPRFFPQIFSCIFR